MREEIDPQKQYKYRYIAQQGWLGIGEAGIYNLIRSGRLQAMNVSSGKKNKRYAILGSEIIRFISANTYHPTK